MHTDLTRLARRYRLLLLAYPRWHRRIHAADMHTALLDAARDRRPPSATKLVLDGIWCRLKVDGTGQFVAVLCLSLIAAAGLSAAAGRIAWQLTAASWPTVADATWQARSVLPPGPPRDIRRSTDLMGPRHPEQSLDNTLLEVLGSPEMKPGGVYLHYIRPPVDRDLAIETARAHLLADNWRVKTGPPAGLRAQEPDHYLVGERAGYRLTFHIIARGSEGTDDIFVSISPLPPAATQLSGLIGALTGLVVGWLMSAAATARLRRRPPTARAIAYAAAATAVVLSMPASLLSLIALAIPDQDSPVTQPWAGYEFALARPAAMLGTLLVVIAWLLSHGPSTNPATRSPQPGTLTPEVSRRP